MENLATQYLRARNETVEDWEGVCGELASRIYGPGDEILYIEGDIPWNYHMVLVRDGLVHDAWCEGDPLPIREWLIRMFGAEACVEVSINGEDPVFDGMCHYFSRPNQI